MGKGAKAAILIAAAVVVLGLASLLAPAIAAMSWLGTGDLESARAIAGIFVVLLIAATVIGLVFILRPEK